jgi:hypothetical protein
LNFEILSSDKDDIEYTLLDMVNPYEINDITTIDKKYIIFKENFYVNIY